MRPIATCVLTLGLGGAGACGAQPFPSDASRFDASLAEVPFVHPDAPADLSGDPRLYVFVTDASRGDGLPCKLTVRGVDGTAMPNWGGGGDQMGEWLDPPSGALGIGRWV